MNVYVNGETKQYTENSTIADIVSELGLENKRIAV
jgi:thiazole synthase